MLTNPKY